MAHGRRSTEAAERVWIFPRRVIVVQRDPLVVPENLVHVAMTGVELAVCQLSAVLSPIAEHAESVERIAHQVGMAVAAVRHTRTEAVIMVAPPAFRMASAGILDFMGDAVPSSGIQRVKKYDPALENADRTHGETRRSSGYCRSGWQCEFVMLVLDAVGIAIILSGRIVRLDWEHAGCMIRKAVTSDGSGCAGKGHGKPMLAPRNLPLHVNFSGRIPRSVVQNPFANPVCPAATEC